MRLAISCLIMSMMLVGSGGAFAQWNKQAQHQSQIELWNKQFHSGDLVGAGRTAAQALSTIPLVDVRRRAFWLARQASLLGASNNVDRAIATFRDVVTMLQDANIVDDSEFMARRGIVQLLARKGELDKAYNRIQETLKRSARVLGARHEQHAYNLSTLAMLQATRGHLPEAAIAFDKARHLFRAAQGDAGFGFEENTARLAGVYVSQGRIQKSIDLLDEALVRFERKLTSRFPPVVDLRLNKADLLTRLDQPEAAAAAAQRAFEDAQYIHPPHHPRIVYAASRYADKLSGVGRIIVARTLVSDALESAARRGRETPEYANLLLISANVEFIINDVPQAISISRRALSIAEKLVPSQHPALVPYLLALSRFKQAAGALDESARMGERALRIVQNSKPLKGADPSILANILNRLSEAYAEQGRYEKAEPAMRRALNIYRDIYTPNHSVIQGALYQLIAQFYAQGRYSEGLSLARRLLANTEERYGHGHLQTAKVLVSMAIGLTHLRQVSEAEKYFVRWKEIADRGMPPPELVFGLTNYGEFRRRIGQADQALKLLDRAVALADRHRLLPKSVGPARVFRATLLLEKGQVRPAESTLREMYAFYNQTLGEQSFQAIGIRRLIAKAVAKQGRYQEAEGLIRDALTDLESKVGPDSTMLRETLQIQRAIFEKLDKPDRVAAVEARLETLPPEGSRHLRLLFATNRASHDGGKGYGSRDAKVLTFGMSRVKVPESEVTHQSERRANSLGQLHAAKGRLAETEKLTILGTASTDRDQFIAYLNKAARRATRFTGQALVFVHGYNNDFEDAMLRASQIAFDLDFDGPVVAFAWPSRGSFLRYGADEKAAATAVPHLAKLLAQLRETMAGVDIHIIAHSMGNRVLMGALDLLAKQKKGTGTKPKFGEIVLAHPDVELASVERVAEAARDLARGFTLYATKDDTALAVSRILNWTDRAGATTKSIAGVDTIDVSGMKAVDATGWARVFVLNHSTFVRNPALFGDITRLLQTGERPVHLRSFGHFERIGHSDSRLWRYSGLEVPVGVAAKTEARIVDSEAAAPVVETK